MNKECVKLCAAYFAAALVIGTLTVLIGLYLAK